MAREFASLEHVELVGLHFHIGSQILDMRIFEYFCKRVNTLLGWFREHGFPIHYLNMGGGLGIDYERPDQFPVTDFADYFATFDRFLDREGMEVHFELGRAVVAQCGELITRVLFEKVNALGHHVVIVDASMSQLIRPALYEAYHAIENLSARSAETGTYTIAGTVCESADVFAKERTLPRLQRGDLLSIKSAGAYGASMASRYNLHDFPESVYSDRL